MALFEGTLEEFERFIGPATNKVVTKLGKQLKKSQKSCQNSTLEGVSSNSENCGKYKSLDAAHFSHKELDRKSIIKNILNNNFKKDEIYSVKLDHFLSLYEQEHFPLNEKLIMLCRQHHSAYDKKYKLVTNYAVEEEIDNQIEIGDQEITKIVVKQLKKKIVNSLEYLKNVDCKIASIINEQWNFNIKNDIKNGYLLCLNQFDRTVTVLRYDFSNDQVGNVKKDGNKISLLIPFSETQFKDKSIDYLYEVIECIKMV